MTPFSQPTEQFEPHPFERSEFGKKGVVYCKICGMSEPNPIHGPRFEGSTHQPLSREAYIIETVQMLARRSTCNRGQVGAVIVREGRIISSGYNGAPPGLPHCTDVGCAPPTGCERTVHAEANAIAWAARVGVTTGGGSMWSTHGPCVNCAKLIISAGIIDFHYLNDYHSQRLDILTEARVNVVHHELAG